MFFISVELHWCHKSICGIFFYFQTTVEILFGQRLLDRVRRRQVGQQDDAVRHPARPRQQARGQAGHLEYHEDRPKQALSADQVNNSPCVA